MVVPWEDKEKGGGRGSGEPEVLIFYYNQYVSKCALIKDLKRKCGFREFASSTAVNF
jgi:hypothetical protein